MTQALNSRLMNGDNDSVRGRRADARTAGDDSAVSPSFALQQLSTKRRLGSFLGSLLLHVALVGTLVVIDARYPRDPSLALQDPTHEELLDDEKYDITWYTPALELPRVAPLNTPADEGGAKSAKHRSKAQTIVANDPNPDSDRQMILGPAPEIKIEQDLPLPNLIAWNTPEISRPRFQLEQPEVSAPERHALATEAAPQLNAAEAPKLDLETLQKRDPLRYRAQQREIEAPKRRTLEARAAPDLAVKAGSVDLTAFQEGPLLRYQRTSTIPKAPEAKAIAAASAPVIDIAMNPELDLGAFQKGPLLRYQAAAHETAAQERTALRRGASAPSTADKGAGLAGLEAGELLASLNRPELPTGFGSLDGRDGGRLRSTGDLGEGALGSTSGTEGGSLGDDGDPGAVVVGLDPDPNARAAIPIGSRRGRFSASPDGGPGGGQLGGGPVNSAALRVPNLSISGGDGSARSGLTVVPGRKRPQPSGGPPPKRQSLRDELRALTLSRDPRDLGGPPLIRPEPANVPPTDPDILFMDRDVFALAINMPNITSRSGSWILRFAERVKDSQRAGEDSGEEKPPQGPLSAPSPRLKVDPKYIRSAMNERVEGTVVLYAVINNEGHVSGVQVMESLDERLDESAISALSQWKFHPATRNSVPVEVDAVVEIPFRLLPVDRTRRRF